jgi:hypothetical protein
MYLSKDELAELLGVSEAQVRQWTRDRVIPPHFYVRQEGNSYSYAPICVALGELVLRLREHFGANSPLPVAIAVAAVPQLKQAWHSSASSPLVVRHGGLEVRVDAAFLVSAKTKLAAIAA